MSLKYQKCNASHLDIVVKIAKETFVAAFEKDNDPDDFDDYVEKAFHPERIMQELQHKDSQFFLVHDSEELVGYFKINVGAAQTDVHDPVALEIERIYVLGAHQGKKIGNRILQKIIGLTREMAKHYIWLGVWEKNPGAIRFYQRHGFEKFGEHAYYIGQDKQTDWLLRLDVQ